MADLDRKAIQEDELQAIIAIFDTVKDLREQDVWKVDRPPEVEISCTPQSSDSVGATSCDHVSVSLRIKLSEAYPDEIPLITLKEAKGLSDKQLAELKNKLEVLCESLIGQEMMFELVNCTQHYLYVHNKPPAKSFYDQMISNNQKEIEEKTRKAEEVERLKQIQEDLEIEAELERQQNEIREENRRRRQARKVSESEERVPASGTSPISRIPSISPRRRTRTESTNSSESSTNKVTNSSNKSTTRCPASHTTVKDLSFNMSKTQYQVLRGQCTYHDPAGCTLFSAFDTTRGIPLSVQQWTLDFTGSKVAKADNLAKSRKLLNSAEQELAKIVKLQDDSLIHYLSMLIITEGAKIHIMVLSEARPGLSLSQFVHLPNKTEPGTVNWICTQLVHSLVYLHSKQIVHKDIKAKSKRLVGLILTSLDTNSPLSNAAELTWSTFMLVPILSASNFPDIDKDIVELDCLLERRNDLPSVVYVDSHMVRLADFGLYRRLNEIHQAASAGNLDLLANAVKRGQKEDVFRLGMTILYMITKSFNEDERMPSVPTNIHKDLKEFLLRCFNADEKTRWSAKQLLDHSYLQPKQQSEEAPNKAPSVDYAKNKEEEEVEDSHIEAVILRDTSGTSRLASEFQILGIIGKGGFGEVLKVRNKLDRCLYAIKRIILNPKSKVLNKRITREVKLLSRLNHENVVRYYNSWIETSEELAETETSTDTATTTTSNTSNNGKRSLMEADDFSSIERNAPQMVDRSVTWSVASSQSSSSLSSSDDESSDDDADLFGHSFMPHVDSDSDDVIFENGSSAPAAPSCADESSDSGATKVQKSPPKPTTSLHRQFMYIQMEYCEKNTLRQAIDSGLHENLDRVWRLFREVIEGLVHLHDQGMIHRDLKPVNIFLDLNDHVKIGDFGLATTAMIAKQSPEDGMGGGVDHPHPMDAGISQSISMGDGRHTGRVGTLLYVSPEIKSSHGKTSYSQKVDIYSLGIIFFEMCYRPLTTLMERDKIIGNIRRPEVVFPSDFLSEQNSKQIAILKWVLDHDADKRPSAAELLQSDYLPQMEEAEIDELFRSTLANPQTKSYKKIISTIFHQPISRKFDFTYDNDVHKGVHFTTLLNRQIARRRLEDIFSKHGAIDLEVPLMLPKLSQYESYPHNVTFMDHAGNLVCLPFDLRVPFARYAARNSIGSLKRYSISKVFRERRPHGIQPHEYVMSAFDIISPSRDSMIPDAEVLSTIQQIVNEFQYLQAKDYSIHMNHNSLLKGILIYCGIPEDQHAPLYEALADSNNKVGDSSKTSRYTKLLNMSINENTASQICSFTDMSGSFSAVSGFLKRITKSGQQAAGLVKTALHEIENVISYSTALGVTLPVVISPGFVYEIHNCSGILYQIAAESVSSKNRSGVDVLACGYRYDKLVSRFKRVTRPDGETEPAAVGMSLVFDKLVYAVSQEKPLHQRGLVQVVLSCTGKSSVQKECLKIANELWSNGVKVEVLSNPSLEMEKLILSCREFGARYLITLTDYEPGYVRLNVIEKERLSDKKYSMADIVEEVVKRLTPTTSDRNLNRYQQGDYASVSQASLSTAEKVDRNTDMVNHTFLTALPITLVMSQDTRQTLKARSKIETTIHNRLTSTVLCLLKKASEAEVVAFDLGLSEVKVIASVYLDSEDEQQFGHNYNIALEKQESARNRKYMSKIFNRLLQIKFQNTKPSVMILFGLKDNSYRVIMG